jgi:hypothetical protein
MYLRVTRALPFRSQVHRLSKDADGQFQPLADRSAVTGIAAARGAGGCNAGAI